MKKRLVVVGGGVAGVTAAIEARKLDKDVKITVLDRESRMHYSHCGLPFVLSGVVDSFDRLILFDEGFYRRLDLNVILNAEVCSVDTEAKRVCYLEGGKSCCVEYTSLILATGSLPCKPKVEGIDNPNVFYAKTMDDFKKLNEVVSKGKSCVVLGAGLIGLEIAAALRQRGLEVSVLECAESVLCGMFDKDVSQVVEHHLAGSGIKFLLGASLKEVRGIGRLCAVTSREKIECDFIVVAAGVKPNTVLAESMGLKVEDGVVVDERMMSSIEGVFACGDCVQCVHCVHGGSVLSQLATAALREAKVAGANAVGVKKRFTSVSNAVVSELAGLSVGSVGLTEANAAKNRITHVSGKYSGLDSVEYWPERGRITVKLVANTNGVLIGGQVVGAGADGVVNLLCLAIRKKASLEELSSMETCYTPPLSPVVNPLSMAAEIALKKLALKSGKK